MTDAVRIEGMETTLKELNREVGKIKNNTMAGLLAAGMIVLSESQKDVPHRLGDLKRSGYSRKAMGGGIAVEIGYSAGYALFVHEMKMVNAGEPRPAPYSGVLWGPSGKPKFLEDALNANTRRVLDIIAAHARKGI